LADSPVRTRIAPSPTGDPHVGTAYVALVNYAFARQHGGQFLLRIEDTDRARSTPESERAILRSLRWLGLEWDEGPDVGGPHGPYRQSERTAIYREHVDRLLAEGHAFRCFCTAERLEEMRQAQRLAKRPPRYDGTCLALPLAESEERAQREPFVVRLRVPSTGSVTIVDLRRGPVTFDWDTVDMQVLLKSDGMPTYHLANVVDDHLMGISHVIRGEEWLSSAPKHVLLYEYFGWQPPALLHLPLLRNPDKSKLSKRKNPTSILFYERMGYLPEALLNFLGLLAAGGSDEELLSLAGVIERLRIDDISLGGPVFDVAKLDWLNGRYLRDLGPAAFVERIATWSGGRDRFAHIAELAQSRIERLSDLGPLLSFFYAGRVAINAESFGGTRLAADEIRRALALAMWELESAEPFDKHAIEQVLKDVAERLGRKFRDLARPYYVAMTGSPTSVPLFDAMEILGRDICRERFRAALEVLGGVSAAEERSWRAAASSALSDPSGNGTSGGHREGAAAGGTHAQHGGRAALGGAPLE
jgi:glutamyl-tRNA synthetase